MLSSRWRVMCCRWLHVVTIRSGGMMASWKIAFSSTRISGSNHSSNQTTRLRFSLVQRRIGCATGENLCSISPVLYDCPEPVFCYSELSWRHRSTNAVQDVVLTGAIESSSGFRDEPTIGPGLRLAPVAQWIEQRISNPLVAGSTPAGGIPQLASFRRLWNSRAIRRVHSQAASMSRRSRHVEPIGEADV